MNMGSSIQELGSRLKATGGTGKRGKPIGHTDVFKELGANVSNTRDSKYRIEYTESAVSDLREITEYIQVMLDLPGAANSLLECFEREIIELSIGNNAEQNCAYDGCNRELALRDKNYRVVYSVNKKECVITVDGVYSKIETLE